MTMQEIIITLQWVVIIGWMCVAMMRKVLVNRLNDQIEHLSTLLKEADIRLNLTMKAQKEQIQRLQEDHNSRNQQMREKLALYEGLHGTPVTIEPTKKRI